MEKNILISVIVPVYNAACYLPRCIESILHQTYVNFELLLVDDGSTDKSGKICDEYALKDTRIKVYHKSNAGVSSARNYALLNIRGGYLTFIDSDDFLDKEHIQALVEHATDYDWVMSSRKVVNERGDKVILIDKVLDKTEAHGKVQVDELCMKIPLFIYVTNKLYKTSIIRDHNIQFIQESHVHEDGLFNYNYACYAESLVMLPDTSYNFTFNPNSLTHSGYTDLKMYIRSAEAINDLLKGNELGEKISLHAAQYMFNLYLRVTLGCIYYPIHILSLKQRCSIIGCMAKSIRESVLISRYRRMVPKWLFFRTRYYLRKFFHRLIKMRRR